MLSSSPFDMDEKYGTEFRTLFPGQLNDFGFRPAVSRFRMEAVNAGLPAGSGVS